MEASMPRDAKLTVLTGQSSLGSEFSLGQGDQYIGRAPECEILLGHPTVSGKHARVFLSGADYYVEDLGSTNGTAVNHRAISSPVALRSGDVIQVGEVHIQFTEDSVPEGATVVGQPEWGAQEQPEMTMVEPAEAWSATSGEQRLSWETGPATNPDATVVEPAEPPAWGEPSAVEGAAMVASEAGQPSADAVAEGRSVLQTLSARVSDLQRDVTAVTDSAARLEGLLADAERERDSTSGQLNRLKDGVRGLADDVDSRAASLGLQDVLANLDGLVNAPNDLGLLVNVSRDASRYADIVRLVQDLPARLRTLEG
jgi:hypothetical protein